MTRIEEAIIAILKEELEHHEIKGNYSQWVMAVGIKKDMGMYQDKDHASYIARVVVKTDESIFVDGMDIRFQYTLGSLEIQPDYFENTPDFQGGTEESSLKWIGTGNHCYLQRDNPFSKVV